MNREEFINTVYSVSYILMEIKKIITIRGNIDMTDAVVKGTEESSKEHKYNCLKGVKKGYQDGLNDAWNAAKKICMTTNHGGLDAPTLYKIFGYYSSYDTIKNISAYEAVKGIKEWEEKLEEKNNEIKIGDEIIYSTDKEKGIVVGISNYTEEISVLYNGYDVPQLVAKNMVIKTGRHFPQIEEVLKQIQEK